MASTQDRIRRNVLAWTQTLITAEERLGKLSCYGSLALLTVAALAAFGALTWQNIFPWWGSAI